MVFPWKTLSFTGGYNSDQKVLCGPTASSGLIRNIEFAGTFFVWQLPVPKLSSQNLWDGFFPHHPHFTSTDHTPPRNFPWICQKNTQTSKQKSPISPKICRKSTKKSKQHHLSHQQMITNHLKNQPINI